MLAGQNSGTLLDAISSQYAVDRKSLEATPRQGGHLRLSGQRPADEDQEPAGAREPSKALPVGVLQAAARAGLVPARELASLSKLFPNGIQIPLGYTYEGKSTYWVAPDTGIVVDVSRSEKQTAGVCQRTRSSGLYRPSPTTSRARRAASGPPPPMPKTAAALSRRSA